MAAVRMAPVAAVVAVRGGLATLETQAAPFSCRRMALRACLFILLFGRVAGGGTGCARCSHEPAELALRRGGRLCEIMT